MKEKIMEEIDGIVRLETEETEKKFRATIESDCTNLSDLVRAIEDVTGGEVFFSTDHEKESMAYTEPVDIPVMKIWVE